MKFLIAIAAALLGVGLVAPSLVLYPAAGEYTHFIKLVRPSFSDPREFSILSGIYTLLRDGDLAIGVLLLVFSVLFPMAKLSLLWCSTSATARPSLINTALPLLERLGKYSMLDVLVIALVVIAMKRLPGGTDAHLGLGALAFAASVMTSALVPPLIRRRTCNQNGKKDTQ